MTERYGYITDMSLEEMHLEVQQVKIFQRTQDVARSLYVF